MAGKTLTRADLSEAVHRQIGLSRSESADLVKTMLDMMSDHLVDGQTVKLSSFGTFMVRAKNGRVGRNPKTGEEVPITPRRVLVFRPSQVMKNVINGLEGGSDED
jgi:integration host factor subunit alpha